MFRNKFIKNSLLSVAAVFTMGFFSACNQEVKKSNVYSNPLVQNRSEPGIVKHTDGKYYLVCAADGASYASLKIRSAEKINQLRYKSEKSISFTNASASGAYSYFWGPELKFINGQWYLFFTASVSSSSSWSQRPFVAKCNGTDPENDNWTILGKIEAVKENVFDEGTNIIDSYSMGPNVFYCNGQWYFAWTQTITDGDSKWDLDGSVSDNDNLRLQIGTDGTGNAVTKDFADLAHNVKNKNNWQCIFIGKTSPEDFTKVTEAAVISVPEYDWECGTKASHSDTDFGNVNDAPAFLIRNGKVFCVYSASDIDESHCMGLLTADESSNLCNYSSWKKSENSVFESSDEFNAYGPGSACFTTDGNSDVMFYSARSRKGLYNGSNSSTTDSYADTSRGVCAKEISWNKDGTPDLRY